MRIEFNNERQKRKEIEETRKQMQRKEFFAGFRNTIGELMYMVIGVGFITILIIWLTKIV